MTKKRHILLIEDNQSDIVLTLEAIKEAGIKSEIHIVRDGDEALKFLYHKGEFTDSVTPQLIILDIHLPKKDGFEVLEHIKQDDRLKSIPVVVLSTSEAMKDIDKAYQMHANCFVAKPVDYHRFAEIIHSIEQFWFEIVKLPTQV